MPFILLFVVLLLLPLLLRLLRLFRRVRRHLEYAREIPGPSSLPLLGNTLDMAGSSESRYDFLMQSAADVVSKGGNVMKLWIMDRLFVFPLSGETAKVLLDSTVEITKGDDYDFLLPWLGRGLLLSTGNKWRVRRRLLTPTFHFSMLEGYMRTFDAQCKVLIDLLDDHVSTDIDVFPFVKRCALDIICETAMGINLDSQRNPKHPYVAAVSGMNQLVMRYVFEPWLWIPPVWWLTGCHSVYTRCLKTLTDFTKNVISERSEAFRRGEAEAVEGTRKCFLDMLVEMAEKSELNEEDIREEVDTFMFEGHDTTSTGIAWSLWCLATHPSIQQRAYEEQREIFGDDHSAECTVEEIKRMNYLEMCVKENDMKMGDFSIPRDTSMVLAFFLIHHNEKSYPHPGAFNPDNFLAENATKRHPYDYAPFSVGLRNCIGQKFAMYEEKVMISWILRRYKLSSSEPFASNLSCPEVVLRPSRGVPIRLERR